MDGTDKVIATVVVATAFCFVAIFIVVHLNDLAKWEQINKCIATGKPPLECKQAFGGRS